MPEYLRTVQLDQAGVIVGLSQDAHDEAAIFELESCRLNRSGDEFLGSTNFALIHQWANTNRLVQMAQRLV
jgi:hypothetical protein